MEVGIIEIAILLVIFQFLLLAFYLFGKSGKRTSNRILGLFFLAFALNLFNAFCFRLSPYLLVFHPYLFYIGAPFVFLLAPLFYFYVLSLAFREFALGRLDFYHLFPFLFFSVYLIVVFHIHPIEVKRDLFTNHQILSEYQWKGLIGLLHLQIIFYLFSIFRLLRSYRAEIKNIYSSIEGIDFGWFKLVSGGLLLVWLLDLSRFGVRLFVPRLLTALDVIVFAGLLLLSYLITYNSTLAT